MGIVTVFVPFGVYPYAISNGSLTVSIHALLWGIMPEDYTFSSPFSAIYILLGRGLFYGFLNLWFGIEVIRYSSNHGRRSAALFSGVLSLLYPVLMVILFLPWLNNANSLMYVGPIPIQFAIGLLLMRYSGEHEMSTVWDEAA